MIRLAGPQVAQEPGSSPAWWAGPRACPTESALTRMQWEPPLPVRRARAGYRAGSRCHRVQGRLSWGACRAAAPELALLQALTSSTLGRPVRGPAGAHALAAWKGGRVPE